MEMLSTSSRSSGHLTGTFCRELQRKQRGSPAGLTWRPLLLLNVTVKTGQVPSGTGRPDPERWSPFRPLWSVGSWSPPEGGPQPEQEGKAAGPLPVLQPRPWAQFPLKMEGALPGGHTPSSQRRQAWARPGGKTRFATTATEDPEGARRGQLQRRQRQDAEQTAGPELLLASSAKTRESPRPSSLLQTAQKLSSLSTFQQAGSQTGKQEVGASIKIIQRNILTNRLSLAKAAERKGGEREREVSKGTGDRARGI